MFKSVALTGLFPTRALALVAGEKLRRATGGRGLVRVLYCGAATPVVAVSVLPGNSGMFGVAVGGALSGLIGFAGLRALGMGWHLTFLALGWCVLLGALAAWWVTGTRKRARILRSLDSRRCRETLAGTQRAVVVVVASLRREKLLREVIESNEGETFDGVNPWLTIATRSPYALPEDALA